MMRSIGQVVLASALILDAYEAVGAASLAVRRASATHEVKMIQDGDSYKFEPAEIAVKQGDEVKFVMISGGPHNVAFDPASIPEDVKEQLSAKMPNQMQPLASPLLTKPNESYTISFAGIKPGKYPYFCMPHMAMNMKGTITVQ